MKVYVTEALKALILLSIHIICIKRLFFHSWSLTTQQSLRTESSHNPIPLVPEMHEQLKEVHIFTKLNLNSAKNLICVRECEQNIASSTTATHFTDYVMPYGLSFAPSLLQAFINEEKWKFHVSQVSILVNILRMLKMLKMLRPLSQTSFTPGVNMHSGWSDPKRSVLSKGGQMCLRETHHELITRNAFRCGLGQFIFEVHFDSSWTT